MLFFNDLKIKNTDVVGIQIACHAFGMAPSGDIPLDECGHNRYLADASEMEKERERLEARKREIDDMFLNLYTDKAEGILFEQRFVKLTAAMEWEQEENQKQLKESTLSLRRSNEQESDVRTFIREIRQYAAVRELDEGILNRLISRILVGEVKKIDGRSFRKSKSFITLPERYRR